MDEKHMLLAQTESKKSLEPLKCGVVITIDDKVIAKAHNSQRKDHNASAHAEIKAIAKAGKKLKSKNLKGCTIFATHEPCSMCLSAMIFAKVKRLVYSISLNEASAQTINITVEDLLKKTKHKLQVKKLFQK